MVKSMTGFGKGEATLQNKKITVEIRSLNSKQLDLGCGFRPYTASRNTKSAISSPARYSAARSMSS